MNQIFLTYFIIFVSLVYVGFVLWMIKNWKTLKEFKLEDDIKEYTSISVIVPFRNEEKNIESCLSEILKQNYPTKSYEIIAIDDHSDDSSADLVKNLTKEHTNLKLLKLKDSHGKKAAMTRAISKAKGNLIVTTDADCIAPQEWLNGINQYYLSTQKKLIILPVIYKKTKGVFQKLQDLEFTSLISSSASCAAGGKAIMANGANLAFERSVFKDVEGYKGNENISSGDDLFLLFKDQKNNPDDIGHMHSMQVAVEAKPSLSISEFLQQRIRWGSKTSSYTFGFATRIAFLIAGVNWLIILLLLFAMGDPSYLNSLLLFFMVKSFADIIFVFTTVSFYGKQKLLLYSPLLALCYPFYIFLVTIMGMFHTPKWKGREIGK